MKLLAIITDTFREGIARKSIIGFFAISTLFLLIALIIALATDATALLAQIDPSGTSPSPLPRTVQFVEAGLTGMVHFGVLFLGIFATAGIIPNTLEKGAIDLVLSKPISRDTLLHGKFLGAVLIIFLNLLFYVLGMWLIISFETGYWNPGFLATVIPVTYSFLILFSAMMVIGVTTRSSALTIILTFAFLYLISPLLSGREFLFQFTSNEGVRSVITALYYILPKPAELRDIAIALVMNMDYSLMPVWTSGLFGGAMYVLAIILMRLKDF